MKKGFTLVELLGVIVLLGVLSLLIVPVVNNMMIESREKLAASQEKAILKAARNWGHANMFMLPDCGGESTCDDTITITLGQIMNEGFLDSQIIKDVNKDKIYSPATEIVVGKHNSQNTYTLAENAYEEDIVTTEGGPTIVLNGQSTIIEEVNRDGSANYIEPGVTVQDKDGNNISYKVTVIKTSALGETLPTPTKIVDNKTIAAGGKIANFGFNTKLVANYKIVYEATAEGKSAKMVRNIQVRDTTAPTITFVNNIEVAKNYSHIYSNTTNLNSSVKFIEPTLSSAQANNNRNSYLTTMSNVVVMDNSCGKTATANYGGITLKITSEIPTAAKDVKLRTYPITYVATDAYGNRFEKVRNVKIIDG